MNREEAMEIVKKLYNDSLFLKKDKEAMLTLIPELAESEIEDERLEKVRETLIKALKREIDAHCDGYAYFGITLKDIVAILEKQKEQKGSLRVIKDASEWEKIKEQKPAEWSEEDEANFAWFDKFFRAESVVANGRDIPQDKYLWFKSLRPQSKNELSEEDKEAFTIAHLVSLGYPIDANGNIPNYNQTFESCKSSLVYWLQQNLQKMLANKRIEPEGIRTETLLKNSYIQAYREGIEDSIRELSSQCENNSPQPHWKPSEEQLSQLQFAFNLLEEKCESVPDVLWNLYDNLKKL